MIPSVAVTRYVTPLREGGSLPGLVEAADLGTYVCKFRGAGQGIRVLIAEVIASALANRLGLRTPRLVALELDAELARYEADEEVQDLLRASVGLNLGVDFLPGSFGFEAGVTPEDEAARILWLDAFLANVDRSWRNPNLLRWHGDTWLIDHGASLYFHHGWGAATPDPSRWAIQPWDATGHVFEALVAELGSIHSELAARLDRDSLAAAVAGVPEEWLLAAAGRESRAEHGPMATVQAQRDRYVDFLSARATSNAWLPQAGPVAKAADR